MHNNVLQKLQTYIRQELTNAALYRDLARISPTKAGREVLTACAARAQENAETFQCAYRSLTGCNCNPPIEPVIIDNCYQNKLEQQVLAESENYRKYAQEYLNTCQNTVFRNACGCACINSNVNALQLLYLLS